MLSPALDQAVRGWLETGPALAALELAARHPDEALPPSWAFAREAARHVIAEAARQGDPQGVGAAPDAFSNLADTLPPMRGNEYATKEALAALWQALALALADAAGSQVEPWLAARHAQWHVAGRVCFHLAENKRDPAFPFAFLATYVDSGIATDKAKHKPLGSALAEYAGANAKVALLALLGPVHRAAQASGFIRSLLDSHAIFQPQRWTATQAHSFLRDAPACEAAGVVVRVPDWWQKRAPARVTVQVTLGKGAPSGVGADALVGFDAALALDGEPLTEDEWRALTEETASLVSLRGRWVEIDRARLSEALAHWKRAQRAAKEGIPFHEAMRMLAGFDGTPTSPAADDAERSWTRVAPGEWLSKTLETLRSPDAASSALPKSLAGTLRPYQEAGVRWLEFVNGLGLGACLADDMGLGKTIQVLSLFLWLKEKRLARAPHLLVVPASLIGNWQSEAARFAPSLRFVVAHPSAMPAGELESRGAKLREGADVVLTTYAMLLRSTWMSEHPWDTMVLDEAQAIKNPGARQTRAAKAVEARMRLALTGTPVENRAGDLWSLFDFLQPGLLGTTTEFKRLSKAATEKSEGWAPVRTLVSPYILRRLKTDRKVISDLPDKTEMLAECGLTREQVGLYQRAIEELKERLSDKEDDPMRRRGAVLAALVRLKQICNHPAQWLADNRWEPERSAKFARVAEILEPIRERQEKVLVFTQFREMVEPLAGYLAKEMGHEGLILHGGTTVAKRRALVERFQSDDAVWFMVLSIRAGGTGLNLTAASHVIHFDRWWNPAVEDQATDRAFRIGQKKNVFVHKLCARGTVDERVDEMIHKKRGLAKELLGTGGEVPLTELSNEELLALVQLDARRATVE